MMRDVIPHSAGYHPFSPKTLPSTTIGFGGTETAANLFNQIRCFSRHRKRNAYQDLVAFDKMIFSHYDG